MQVGVAGTDLQLMNVLHHRIADRKIIRSIIASASACAFTPNNRSPAGIGLGLWRLSCTTTIRAGSEARSGLSTRLFSGTGGIHYVLR